MHRFIIIATAAIRGISRYYKSVQLLIQIKADLPQISAQQPLMSYLRKTNGLIEFSWVEVVEFG